MSLFRSCRPSALRVIRNTPRTSIPLSQAFTKANFTSTTKRADTGQVPPVHSTLPWKSTITDSYRQQKHDFSHARFDQLFTEVTQSNFKILDEEEAASKKPGYITNDDTVLLAFWRKDYLWRRGMLPYFTVYLASNKAIIEELSAKSSRTSEEDESLQIAKDNVASQENAAKYYQRRIIENEIGKIGYCKHYQIPLVTLQEKIVEVGEKHDWNLKVAMMLQCVLDLAERHGLDIELVAKVNRIQDDIEGVMKEWKLGPWEENSGGGGGV